MDEQLPSESPGRQVLAPLGGKKSIMTKLVDGVRSRPHAALGIIILLVLLVAFLYVRHRGWFGLGGAASGSAGGKASKAGKASKKKPTEDDIETDSLIDSINKAGK